MYEIAFVGMPNAGKTSWINFLAKTNLKVANYLGVSVKVEKVKIKYKKQEIHLIDLPGFYDLYIASGEEQISISYLKNQPIDLLVYVMDIRDIQKGLHLCVQLKTLQIPMVVLLNFVDKNISKSSIQSFSRQIHTPILCMPMNHRKKALDFLIDASFKENTIFEERSVSDFFLFDKKHLDLDVWLLHPILGMLFLVMIVGFSFSLFFFIGEYISAGIDFLLSYIYIILQSILLNMSVSSTILSLFLSFSSILSFLPYLFCLFLWIALLEESGYMARIAYLMDPIMRFFHQSGKSVIPMLIGYGCSVPAILATRTIENEKQKKACALCIPFLSCSGKLPFFLLFSSLFFKEKQALVLGSIYGISLLVSLFIGMFFSTKEESYFMMELPSYCVPKFKIVVLKVWKECSAFLKKVFVVMLLGTLLLWLLFPYIKMDLIQKVLMPLGFAENYDVIEALPFSLLSKENILLYFSGKAQGNPLSVYISSLWIGKEKLLSAFSYLLYISMSIPCVMTLTTIKSEFGLKFMFLSIALMLFIPFVITLFVYQFFVLIHFLF